jgi:hypothetical protein
MTKDCADKIHKSVRTLRRSIGAAFILGVIITSYAQIQGILELKFAGPILTMISAIHYGYARKAEMISMPSTDK